MAKALADLVVIGPQTFLYTPPKPRSGRLIICTWLGAARKQIAKYTDLFRQVALDACTLISESSVGILTSTLSANSELQSSYLP